MFDISALLAMMPTGGQAGATAALGGPIPLTGTPGNPAAGDPRDNGAMAKLITGSLRKMGDAATALSKPKTVIGQTSGGGNRVMGGGDGLKAPGGSPGAGLMAPGAPVPAPGGAPDTAASPFGKPDISALLQQIFGSGPAAGAFPQAQPPGFGTGQLY